MFPSTTQGNQPIDGRVLRRRVIGGARPPANYFPPVNSVQPVPTMAAIGSGRKLARFIWTLVRAVLFFTLRVLRPFIILPLRIVGGICVIVSLVLVGLSWHNGWRMSMLETAGGSFLVAVGLSALSWYYDMLLLKLAPQGVQLLVFN